ncbi:MAG: hypothetical protein KKD48_03430 [Nanoarchaeota archaeon]|nr:hypothetical protein [Nanoarchaeota archaeon]
MAKLTAWLVTVIGLILAIAALNLYTIPYQNLIIALAVLAIGVGKLLRNYKLIKTKR